MLIMSSPDYSLAESQPKNLCELFLRDVAMLLVTSQLIKRSLIAIRPEYAFSEELQKALDTIIALTESGEPHLREPLLQAGAVLPELAESSASAVVAGFMASIPVKVTQAVLAAELTSNLRILVQHLELKAILAAEAAVLIGQKRLSHALLKWSAEWRSCGQILRAVTVRVRAQAYVADLDGSVEPQVA